MPPHHTANAGRKCINKRCCWCCICQRSRYIYLFNTGFGSSNYKRVPMHTVCLGIAVVYRVF